MNLSNKQEDTFSGWMSRTGLYAASGNPPYDKIMTYETFIETLKGRRFGVKCIKNAREEVLNIHCPLRSYDYI